MSGRELFDIAFYIGAGLVVLYAVSLAVALVGLLIGACRGDD